jgi:hypothetical protein
VHGYHMVPLTRLPFVRFATMRATASLSLMGVLYASISYNRLSAISIGP